MDSVVPAKLILLMLLLCGGGAYFLYSRAGESGQGSVVLEPPAALETVESGREILAATGTARARLGPAIILLTLTPGSAQADPAPAAFLPSIATP